MTRVGDHFVVAEAVVTDRLRLVPWDGHAYDDAFAALCRDADAMRYISDGRPLSLAVVEEILERIRRMWNEHGFGPWAALERTSGRWVGRIGLNLLADWPEPETWEVGYELVPRFSGSGLATEGARRAIRFAWSATPLDRVVSVTRPDHLASRRVMEKAGLTCRGETTWRGAVVVWYAIDRPPGR